VSSQEVLTKYENDFNQCQIRYGDMKKQLADDLIRFITPIREKAAALQNDPAEIDRILTMGAEKARESADATLTEVRKALGFRHL
jgi:tryptophanyl-tRNA synthetase